jgi:hypothetical protein
MVTVTCGTSLYDLTALHPADTFDGTRFTDPQMMHAMANLVADSTPDFYLESIKRLVQHGIQPYFALPHVHGLELVERLIRKGYYMDRSTASSASAAACAAPIPSTSWS